MQIIKLLIFILLFSSLRTPAGFCQEEAKERAGNFLFFSTGVNSIRENLLIPKVNRGWICDLSYGHENEDINFSSIDFSLGFGMLKTKLETGYLTINLRAEARYSKGYIINLGEHIRYFPGFNVMYSWLLMEYPVWDESRAYWSTCLAAGPYNRLEMQLKDRNKLILSWNLGIAGFLSRPAEVRIYAQEHWSLFPILQTTNSNYKPVLADNMMLSSLTAEYRLAAREKISIGLLFNNTFIKTSEKARPDLLVVRNTAGLSLGF